MSHRFYYQKDGTWVGDIMACSGKDEIYMYYQCDKRIPVPFPNCPPFGWSLAKTKDLINFEDFGEVLHTGERLGHTEWLYAGTVIYAKEQYWAYYTSHVRQAVGTDQIAELILIANSPDGIHWTKHPEWEIPKPEGYEPGFLRDPGVFYNEEDGLWWMITPQRHAEGPFNRRGCMTYYTSSDLMHWEFQGDLWAPDMYYMHEMADLFKIGGWYYLLFSEYSDGRRTRYRMSKSLSGPWIAPKDDCFEGRCLYAARTIEFEGVRYLFGWNPTRSGDDLSEWVWGGTAVVHELRQKTDGTLSVHLPTLQDSRFVKSSKTLPSQFTLNRIDGCDEIVLLKDTGDFYRLDLDVSFSEGTFAFGVKMYDNPVRDCGYVYHFMPGKKTVVFDKLPNYPWFLCQNRDLERPVELVPGQPHHITVIVDDDICMLYVDGVALGSRMTEKPGRELKLYVHGGQLQVKSLCFYDQLNK